MLYELNGRSQEVLRRLVEEFMQTGQPVGSRTLSRRLQNPLSPATIRNVMADLEDSGLLFSPHTSAGRLPTQLGLRLFVDGLLEVGNLTDQERSSIEGPCNASGRTVEEMLSEATEALSGLSRCAGLVLAPTADVPFKQVEFASLGPGEALAIMVTESGVVENRVINLPPGMPQSALTEAANYLNARLSGRTLEDVRAEIHLELAEHRAQLDELSAKVVEAGLATWANEKKENGTLIVRGRANLLDDVTAMAELDRIRGLFEALDSKEGFVQLLESTEGAEGVQIFIGAENELFHNTECSMIVAPYRDSKSRFIGAIGVIGPTRINYARIVPLVDHTASVIGRILS
ncbi:MAG: heat-inducible transcriptional repressor HrcA [Rhodospirillaceae bacterium]|nr:heat-inducible transcriptional repressor HrcA [Rhodospirillaceae bacterium]MBT3928648.1 heat-inducible transcriptional repressor HrcA [Rhodospirillaceae bacterium]MBT4425481.1 heat-inducible transcriptional repressor HrcA [Rhodospirillaceae bacterium]MBT5038601.1 heat-inducible transcriptional repressor HrcA [Rhodospirillaceae bacterium]MBT5676431.1 heat-inducible transcriptional repressor HrcA [Rhodospirillaceae bacterium]